MSPMCDIETGRFHQVVIKLFKLIALLHFYMFYDMFYNLIYETVRSDLNPSLELRVPFLNRIPQTLHSIKEETGVTQVLLVLRKILN